MAAEIWAVVLCAGSSTRFGSDKLAALLGGRPVREWAQQTLRDHPQIAGVVVVGNGEGGATRQESVSMGLAQVPASATHILVHDGARPLLSAGLVDRLVAALLSAEQGVAPTLPVVDTIRRGEQLVERDGLSRMQTPQGGPATWMRAVHSGADATVTDDIELLLRAGHPVCFVPGEEANAKVTTVADLEHLKHFMKREVRTGLGYDIHRFSEDPRRPLWLGGQLFPDHPGLEGHSDADPLLHAVVDAVLGAAALGDIGLHYPNTDPRWRDRPSLLFLEEAAALVASKGWRVEHVDATVLAESPKVLPHRNEIQHNIGRACGIQADCVNLKATTLEGLGALGRKEGIAAMATATLSREIF